MGLEGEITRKIKFLEETSTVGWGIEGIYAGCGAGFRGKLFFFSDVSPTIR
jgi:hypothetical protein